MRYIQEFRNQAAALALRAQIEELATKLPSRKQPLRIMEVCGTHTVAMARSGIRSLLPPNIDLISGPGCPVCVTDTGYIDAALELALRGVHLATFGDMLKVPGTHMTLAQARGEGATVDVCYSPLDALKNAAEYPGREIVFLGVGFETTTAPVVSIVAEAERMGLKNISILTAFKTVPAAMHALACDPEVGIQAFLCPAHVSAMIGAAAYAPIVLQHRLPCVIAGFEPLDIWLGLKGILEQVTEGRAEVENQYRRVVRPEGNKKAQAVIERYLEPYHATWRGIGTIPASGLKLREAFSKFDAAVRFGIEIQAGTPPRGCRCGEVLKGILKPPQCGIFGTTCTPEHPVGPCMVSSEGSCAAYYRYREAA